MKKIVISFILAIFLFNIFYPAIYATENILTNEETEIKEDRVEQKDDKEKSETEYIEEVSEEDEIPEIDETSKTDLKEENKEVLEDDKSSVEIEETKEKLKEDSEVDENIEDIEENDNSDIENKEEEIKENKEEKIITEVPEIDSNIGVSYSGKMYIETPNNGTKFTLPDNNTLAVKGWAVSNDKAVLKAYIDNKYIKNIDKRYKRADVDKTITGYGGTAKTPNAGFQTELNISNLSLGNHTIKIEQVSNTGVIICSETRSIVIAQKVFSGKMNVETPAQTSSYVLPDNKTMQIKGWAVSDDIGAYMLVYIDGKKSNYTTTRSARADVDKLISPSYGGIKATPKAEFVLDVDITNISNGTHEVLVMEVSRYHKIMCQTKLKIDISRKNYKGKMYVESPSISSKYTLPENSKMEIKGWAVSDDIGAYMLVYINGSKSNYKVTRIERKDVEKAVSPAYGGKKTTPKEGFILDVDISNLVEGKYNITVMQVSRYHQIMNKTELKISITTKSYIGKMYIESPQTVDSYKLSETTKIQIKGWAVSNDIGAYMLVYINGKKSNYTTTRITRSDVDKMVSPSYGGTSITPKAGFILDVDIGNLSDGKYDIKVMEVSRFHKIMCETNMKVTITTPNYTGKIFVETPMQNNRYSSGRLEIKGWSLSDDKDDVIKISLDGKFIAIAERQKRQDVLLAFKGKYGGDDLNKYPGFYSVLDTSNLGEGMHTIKIINYSKYGKEIQASQISFMISNTKTWGIDVSHYQDDIDWNTVKNQGINFAILKIGEYRESSGRVIKDSKFEQNYMACKNHGIAVGGYFYSYAFDPTEASHEAAACLSIISGKSFELPIFLDIEDDLIKNAVNKGTTNQSNLTNGAITFCNIMNQSGYKSGVYASKNFYQTYLYTPLLESFNIWLAHYTGATNYTGRYDIWQYTSNGSLAGIRGAVDMNWCFRKY